MITITIERQSVYKAVQQNVFFAAELISDIETRYKVQIGEEKSEMIHGVINAAVAELQVLLRPWTMHSVNTDQSYKFDTASDIAIQIGDLSDRKDGITPMLTTLMHSYLQNRSTALYLSMVAQPETAGAYQSQAGVAENAIYNTLNIKNKPIV